MLKKKLLVTKHLLGQNIHLFESCESTMGLARKSQNLTEPQLFISETQTQGHGRFKRPYFCPPGQIYMSLALTPEPTVTQLPQYTLIAAVAIAQTIDKYTNEACQIKWVNDLYIRDKKVAGILTEAVADSIHGIRKIIIGIGVNFAMADQDFPPNLCETATALFKPEQAIVSRENFIQDIWRNFFTIIATNDYLPIYRKKSFVLGKEVSFQKNDITYTGIATDITAAGALIVKTTNDTLILSSGEISLTNIK